MLPCYPGFLASGYMQCLELAGYLSSCWLSWCHWVRKFLSCHFLPHLQTTPVVIHFIRVIYSCICEHFSPLRLGVIVNVLQLSLKFARFFDMISSFCKFIAWVGCLGVFAYCDYMCEHFLPFRLGVIVNVLQLSLATARSFDRSSSFCKLIVDRNTNKKR